MSALTVEAVPDSGNGWDELVHLWKGLDAPEGCKVEIIEGIVTAAPPPNTKHNLTAARVQRLLYTVIPEDWNIYQTLGVELPGQSGLFVPDLAVVPDAAVDGGPPTHIPADTLELVVEVTSPSNAVHDRVQKLRSYAAAAVPLYLLLDRCRPGTSIATLYGEPEDGHYRVLETVKYGEELPLPAPFDVTLDTGSLPLN